MGLHTFKVVKEDAGWAVKLGEALIAPCRSQLAALAEAQRMAEALARNGEAVAIAIDRDQEAQRLAAPLAAAGHVWASRRELRAR
ncbi:MAG: hypothetical protein BroJett013_25410 [Alphaproteobacteria bacterium]|nr:MAG: hypothetical protein BroJett013_25410 [Alphaproteobacteria bacterium]